MFHKELHKLFAAYPKSFVKLSLTGESGSNGKKEAPYITVHEDISPKVWKDHLDGKYRIGLRPELGDECVWACIDIDPNDYKNFSKKKTINIIANFNLPFIPVVSKSGGLHLFIFFTKPAKIDKVKEKLQEYNEQ